MNEIYDLAVFFTVSKMSFFTQATLTVLFLVTVFIVRETECLDMKGEGVCVARLRYLFPLFPFAN